MKAKTYLDNLPYSVLGLISSLCNLPTSKYFLDTFGTFTECKEHIFEPNLLYAYRKKLPIAYNDKEAKAFIRRKQEFILADNMDDLNINHMKKIKHLPEWFGYITTKPNGEKVNLKIMHMEQTTLTALPESFGLLTTLEKIYAYKSKLKSLPESFGLLTNLTRLNLSCNQLKSLPNSFGSLTRLEEFYRYDNSEPFDIPVSLVLVKFGNII